jgi:hypothetical protein
LGGVFAVEFFWVVFLLLSFFGGIFFGGFFLGGDSIKRFFLKSNKKGRIDCALPC